MSHTVQSHSFGKSRPSSDDLVYMASPYTHPLAEVRAHRLFQAQRATADLMSQGVSVFSPVMYSAPIGEILRNPLDHKFWMHHCRNWLMRCEDLYVLCIDGWQDSKGIAMEVEWAEDVGIPVSYWVLNDFMQVRAAEGVAA